MAVDALGHLEHRASPRKLKNIYKGTLMIGGPPRDFEAPTALLSRVTKKTE